MALVLELKTKVRCKDCCGKDWAGGISGERFGRSAGKRGKCAKAERAVAWHSAERHCAERHCAAWRFRFTGVGAEAPVQEAPGCGERGEGLQGGLHCVSWERGQGRSHVEHGVSAVRYVSGFHGLRGDDA